MQFTEDGSTKQSITGKHSYVYGPTGESVTNEEEVWSILQKDVEVYNRNREEVGLEGLEESDIDRQALNCLLTVPLTDEIVKEEDSDEDQREGIGDLTKAREADEKPTKYDKVTP